MIDAILCVLILVFILLSAFFSSAEIAFARANSIRIKKQAEQGDARAKKEQFINEHYTRSLSTVLVGNNLVNIAASSAATVVCVRHLGASVGQTVAAAALTVLLLIFGETLPKMIAATVPDKLARAYSAPLRFFMVLFFPVVWLVDKLVELLSPLWTPKEKAPAVTTEELSELVDDIEDDGVFSEEDSELIKSAIDFTETTAVDILVPRVDMFAIDIEDEDELEITDEFYKYSRIPVYRGSIDNIIGVLPVKRYLRELAAGGSPRPEDMLLPALFVHKTKPVSAIIAEFRRRKTQMAIVVDEYGGTMGILTMEDITEDIVGDIFDERDEVEDDVRKVDENTYIVDGSVNVEDVFELFDWEPQDFETEYTTIGGWATEMLDKFPVAGDNFEYQRLKVTVLKAASMRVESVRVEYTPPEDEHDSAEDGAGTE